MISPSTHSLPQSAIYICPDSHSLLLQMGCRHACFIPTACENLGRLVPLARCGARTFPIPPLHLLAQFGPEPGHYTVSREQLKFKLEELIQLYLVLNTMGYHLKICIISYDDVMNRIQFYQI